MVMGERLAAFRIEEQASVRIVSVTEVEHPFQRTGELVEGIAADIQGIGVGRMPGTVVLAS